MAQLNALRTGLGQNALIMDARLTDAAMQRAAELSIFYDHIRPDASPFSAALTGMNISGPGENIALGYDNAKNVMDAWTTSPGNYANMTNSSYSAVGVGCFYQDDGTRYWVQVFAAGGAFSKNADSGKKTLTKEVRALGDLLDLEVDQDAAKIQIDDTQTFSLYNIVNQGWAYTSPTKIMPPFYESADTDIAVVDSNGEVRGVASGSTTIRLGMDSGLYLPVTVTIPDADQERANAAFAVKAESLIGSSITIEAVGPIMTVQADYGIPTIKTIAPPPETSVSKITAIAAVTGGESLMPVPMIINGDGTIAVLVSGSMVLLPLHVEAGFTDISTHWGAPDIMAAAELMIVEGVGNGRFSPSASVTNAESATMFLRAFGIDPGSGAPPLEGIDQSRWYADIINTAAMYGLVSPGIIPDAPMTRIETAELNDLGL